MIVQELESLYKTVQSCWLRTLIYDNSQSGIEVTGASNPEIKFNRIRSNAQKGIFVQSNWKSTLAYNKILKGGLQVSKLAGLAEAPSRPSRESLKTPSRAESRVAHKYPESLIP